MKAYLKRYHGKFMAVAFFATCDVSGTSKVLREMESICGLKPRASLEINEAEMKSGTYLEKARQFVHELQGES